MKNTADFKFFLPVEITKAKDKDGEEEMIIEGCASDASEDSDGEMLHPNGYDLSYFKKFGFLNWQHRAGTDPASIVGEPIDARVENNKFYIKGRLFKDNPLAQDIFKLAKTLSDNGSTRRLGFSIEGKALAKDLLNPKIITRAKITGVAITPTPKNSNTFLDVVKGEYKEGGFEDEFEKEDTEEVEKMMTTASGAPLTRESLEGNQKDLNKTKKTLTKSEVFGKIFTTFPKIDLEMSKSVYNFMSEVQSKLDPTMKQISSEAIEAATQILKAASDNLNKAEGNVATPGAPNVQAETNVANGASQSDFGTKAQALIAKAMSEKKSKEDIFKAAKEMPDYDEDKMSKAYDKCEADMKKAKDDGEEDEDEDDEDDDNDGVEKATKKEMKKGMNTDLLGSKKAELARLAEKPAEIDINKGFDSLADLIKGQTASFDKKFAAIGTLHQSTSQHIELLKGELETLSTRLEELEGTSTKRTVRTQAFIQKGQEDEFNQKSKKTVSLGNKPQIVKALEGCIDIQKSEPQLVDDFLRYESAGLLTKGLANELMRAGYAITD